MNYELAKQLKEKGFEPKRRGYVYIFSKGHEHSGCKDKWNYKYCKNTTSTGLLSGTQWIYVPTLEELIEACGDNLIWIRQYFEGNLGFTEDTRWFARGPDRVHPTGPAGGDGSTLEEAVAKLWLELNK